MFSPGKQTVLSLQRYKNNLLGRIIKVLDLKTLQTRVLNTLSVTHASNQWLCFSFGANFDLNHRSSDKIEALNLWIESMNRIYESNTCIESMNQIKESRQWTESMIRIKESNPIIESKNRINESNQWIESMNQINQSNQWIELWPLSKSS